MNFNTSATTVKWVQPNTDSASIRTNNRNESIDRLCNPDVRITRYARGYVVFFFFVFRPCLTDLYYCSWIRIRIILINFLIYSTKLNFFFLFLKIIEYYNCIILVNKFIRFNSLYLKRFDISRIFFPECSFKLINKLFLKLYRTISC